MYFARKLRVNGSASATAAGMLVFIIGAAGTGSATTSPACGATCSGFFTASGTVAGAAADGKRGPCDQAGDTKTGQDLFQVG